MHQAALLKHGMEDARLYGWSYDEKGMACVASSVTPTNGLKCKFFSVFL